jgi:hypothetical protein
MAEVILKGWQKSALPEKRFFLMNNARNPIGQI